MDLLISKRAAINAIENTDCELSLSDRDALINAILRIRGYRPETTTISPFKINDVVVDHFCTWCECPVDIEDNYCRHCGRLFIK